jgi:hypothetical protein
VPAGGISLSPHTAQAAMYGAMAAWPLVVVSLVARHPRVRRTFPVGAPEPVSTQQLLVVNNELYGLQFIASWIASGNWGSNLQDLGIRKPTASTPKVSGALQRCGRRCGYSPWLPCAQVLEDLHSTQVSMLQPVLKGQSLSCCGGVACRAVNSKRKQLTTAG